MKEGEPSKRFLAEVQKYFEKQKTEKTVSRDTRQTSNGKLKFTDSNLNGLTQGSMCV